MQRWVEIHGVPSAAQEQASAAETDSELVAAMVKQLEPGQPLPERCAAARTLHSRCRESEHAPAAAAAAGAVPLLVALLQAGVDSLADEAPSAWPTSAAWLASVALSDVCWGCVPACTQAVQAGAAAALVAFLSACVGCFTDDASTSDTASAAAAAEVAATAVRCLTFGSSDTQLAFTERGVVPHLLALLQPGSALGAMEQAAFALWNLSPSLEPPAAHAARAAIAAFLDREAEVMGHEARTLLSTFLDSLADDNADPAPGARAEAEAPLSDADATAAALDALSKLQAALQEAGDAGPGAAAAKALRVAVYRSQAGVAAAVSGGAVPVLLSALSASFLASADGDEASMHDPHALWALRDIMETSVQARSQALSSGVASLLARKLLLLERLWHRGVGAVSSGESSPLYATLLLIWDILIADTSGRAARELLSGGAVEPLCSLRDATSLGQVAVAASIAAGLLINRGA